MRHGSAVETSRLPSSTLLAWCGLQTSKIRHSRANGTPFSAILALRSCTASTPNLWRETARSRSAAKPPKGLADSTTCSIETPPSLRQVLSLTRPPTPPEPMDSLGRHDLIIHVSAPFCAPSGFAPFHLVVRCPREPQEAVPGPAVIVASPC